MIVVIVMANYSPEIEGTLDILNNMGNELDRIHETINKSFAVRVELLLKVSELSNVMRQKLISKKTKKPNMRRGKKTD